MEKTIKIVLMLIITLTIFSVPVLGIGIVTDDQKRNIDFSPKASYEFDYVVRTTTSSDVEITLIDENEVNLSQYITITPNIFLDTHSGEIHNFKVSLDLPESIEIPGPHTVKIKVSETDLDTTDSIVAAKSSSTARLIVHIPYPGKYLRIYKFSIADIGESDPLQIRLDVKNYGTETVDSAIGRITIYSLETEDIPERTVYTEDKPIAPQKLVNFPTTVNAGQLKPGKYKADARVKYEGTEYTPTVTKYFNIGTLDLKLLNYSKQIEKKSIQKFEIVVENSWNNKISDVFGSLNIPGYIGEIKTPTIELRPFEWSPMTAYIDTEKLELGTHKATIILNFENQIKEYPIEFELVEEITKPETQKAGSLSSLKTMPISIITIALLAIVILLILVNLILHRPKEEKEKKKQKKEKKEKKSE